MRSVVKEIPGDGEVIEENEDNGVSGGLEVWELDCHRAKPYFQPLPDVT